MAYDLVMEINYPTLHEQFVRCYFENNPEKFLSILLECLANDKFSRKSRFHGMGDLYPFFNQKDPVKNLGPVLKVFSKLFNLKSNGHNFVVKSYYLLDRVVSFAKREGSLEVVDYIDANPQTKTHPRYSRHYYDSFHTTHENPDLSMKDYKAMETDLTAYCQKYRQNVFLALNELKSVKRG